MGTKKQLVDMFTTTLPRDSMLLMNLRIIDESLIC